MSISLPLHKPEQLLSTAGGGRAIVRPWGFIRRRILVASARNETRGKPCRPEALHEAFVTRFKHR